MAKVGVREVNRDRQDVRLTQPKIGHLPLFDSKVHGPKTLDESVMDAYQISIRDSNAQDPNLFIPKLLERNVPFVFVANPVSKMVIADDDLEVGHPILMAQNSVFGDLQDRFTQGFVIPQEGRTPMIEITRLAEVRGLDRDAIIKGTVEALRSCGLPEDSHLHLPKKKMD